MTAEGQPPQLHGEETWPVVTAISAEGVEGEGREVVQMRDVDERVRRGEMRRDDLDERPIPTHSMDLVQELPRIPQVFDDMVGDDLFDAVVWKRQRQIEVVLHIHASAGKEVDAEKAIEAGIPTAQVESIAKHVIP